MSKGDGDMYHLLVGDTVTNLGKENQAVTLFVNNNKRNAFSADELEQYKFVAEQLEEARIETLLREAVHSSPMLAHIADNVFGKQ